MAGLARRHHTGLSRTAGDLAGESRCVQFDKDWDSNVDSSDNVDDINDD